MSHATLNFADAARYLHLTSQELELLVRRREIPFVVSGSRTMFAKSEIDVWASRRILEFNKRKLRDYHCDSHRGTVATAGRQPLVSALLAGEFIMLELAAKTRASVLREMVSLADKTGWLVFPQDLLISLEAREALCSTAMPGGLALLHPRHHDEYMFDKSFLLLARAIQPIPFNAPDGKRTDIFFLLCCRDDYLHLHLLSRLCMMCMKTMMLDRLRQAPSSGAALAVVTEMEQEVLGGMR